MRYRMRALRVLVLACGKWCCRAHTFSTIRQRVRVVAIEAQDATNDTGCAVQCQHRRCRWWRLSARCVRMIMTTRALGSGNERLRCVAVFCFTFLITIVEFVVGCCLF